jgi:hypothetical protein
MGNMKFSHLQYFGKLSVGVRKQLEPTQLSSESVSVSNLKITRTWVVCSVMRPRFPFKLPYLGGYVILFVYKPLAKSGPNSALDFLPKCSDINAGRRTEQKSRREAHHNSYTPKYLLLSQFLPDPFLGTGSSLSTIDDPSSVPTLACMFPSHPLEGVFSSLAQTFHDFAHAGPGEHQVASSVSIAWVHVPTANNYH